MAVQRSRRSRIACDLRRDAAHASGVEGADQQDGPQRCARYCTDDAGWALPSGACEDDTQSETANAAATHRKLLQSKAIAIDNDLRATLRYFGLKVGIFGKVKFEARISELVENLPDLAALVEPMLIVRRTLSEQMRIMHSP